MAEVSPPNRVDPAARTVSQAPTTSPNRTAISSSFRGLLRDPRGGVNWAHGPAVGHHLWSHPETPVRSPPAAGHGRARRDEEEGSFGHSRGRQGPHAPLDPMLCQIAAQAGITPGVGGAPGAPVPSAALPLREDLQNLIAGLARRVAWGGDRRKGSARIELSEGALAGATLVVHTEQRAVTVELELPAGAPLAGDWQQRILERLEGRGFSAHVRVG
jgi:hypothetical protein